MARHFSRWRSSSAETTWTSANGLPESSIWPPGSIETVSPRFCDAMT